MPGTVVDEMWAQFGVLSELVEEDAKENADLTTKNFLEANFSKTMLICAASYFERRLSIYVEEFTNHASSSNTLVVSLVKNESIHRQYHTWFKWDESNANALFAMFGNDFKRSMIGKINGNDDLRRSVSDFLKIGHLRNSLAHGDFGNFDLGKTSTEVYELYQSAIRFVDFVPEALRAY
ncbi:RiboL-PSP-HEPN domain-containing protein [uncultured Gammaproteobacteria bacterium]